MKAHGLSFLLPLLDCTTAARSNPKDAILLSTVSTLTLFADQPTTSRRVAPVPQLTCEGPGCRLHTISTLRCTNAGTGYGPEDVQWTCTAPLPRSVKLGSTNVQCEGYDSPDDPRVLRGSCAVTYRLLLTTEGEALYSALPPTPSTFNDWGARLFLALFIAVAAWIAYKIFCALTGRQPEAQRQVGRRRPGGGGGGGGGWGGGGGGGGGGGPWRGNWPPDSDEPPPPYSARPSKSQQPNAGPASAGSGRPGFWTGALGGAAAGYLASQATRRRNDVGGGRWGGGSGWGDSSAGPSRYGGGWGGSDSGSSGGGGTYEGTGFGGTSRR